MFVDNLWAFICCQQLAKTSKNKRKLEDCHSSFFAVCGWNWYVWISVTDIPLPWYNSCLGLAFVLVSFLPSANKMKFTIYQMYIYLFSKESPGKPIRLYFVKDYTVPEIYLTTRNNQCNVGNRVKSVLIERSFKECSHFSNPFTQLSSMKQIPSKAAPPNTVPY